MGKKIPYVGHLYSLCSIQNFSKDYLKPQVELFEKFGDRVALALKPSVILLYHPDDVQQVLKTNQKNYIKSDEMKELWPVLGQGLVTSNGDIWKKHRRAIAPEFSSSHMSGFHEVFEKHLTNFLSQSKGDGQMSLNPALSKLTYQIAGECFFGTTVEETAEVIYSGIEDFSVFAVKRMASPWNWPYSCNFFPSHRKIKKTVSQMNDVVFDIINERVKNPDATDKKDVLSRLTRIVGDAGKPMFSVDEIRDEVMTLLLAGHETTANALCWTFYLLCNHQDVQNKMREEIHGVVSGDVPSLQEISDLKYCHQVFNEAMRLYPPVPMLGRKALGEDEISGFHIPHNSKVNLCQYITHRHPEFWSEPDQFLPDRFEDESKIYPFSFFPFGGGARECVGKQMALVEGLCVLASLIKAFKFDLQSQDIQMRPLITLRPFPDIQVSLSEAPQISF